MWTWSWNIKHAFPPIGHVEMPHAVGENDP